MREEVEVGESDREQKIQRVAELLPRAREELGALVGDFRRIQQQIEALESALAGGGEPSPELLRDTARAFAASPAVMRPVTKAFAIEDHTGEPDDAPLRDLGQLVVELAQPDE